MRDGQSDALLWEETDVVGPNVTNRMTLQTLAKMTNNAYYEPSEKGWYDLGPDWNAVRHVISLSQNFAKESSFSHIHLAGNQTRTASGVTYL